MLWRGYKPSLFYFIEMNSLQLLREAQTPDDINTLSDLVVFSRRRSQQTLGKVYEDATELDGIESVWRTFMDQAAFERHMIQKADEIDEIEDAALSEMTAFSYK